MEKNKDIKERVFAFAVDIINLVQKHERSSFTLKILASQVMRSGTSIGANIEEAQAAESKNDFVHKYNIALKEARETKYWLLLLQRINKKFENDAANLIKECDEIAKIIAQIIINIKRNMNS